jgi:DNA-binding GntR family transcriptional regulator
MPSKVRRIADAILLDIADGRLRAGDRVESERMLTRQFGVSLGTAQKALQELEHRGVVQREPGRGTFVKREPIAVDARYIRFKGPDGKDLPIDLHVLGTRKAPASGEWSRFLGVACMRIERRIDVSGRLELISEFFLGLDTFEALVATADLKTDKNLRELLAQRLALPTLRIDQFVRFESLPRRMATRLGLPLGQPGFVMELRGYTLDDRPLYYQRVFGGTFGGASLVITR